MHNVSEQNNIHTIIRLHTSYTTHVKREQALHAMHASERFLKGGGNSISPLYLSLARVCARVQYALYTYIHTYLHTNIHTNKHTYVY